MGSGCADIASTTIVNLSKSKSRRTVQSLRDRIGQPGDHLAELSQRGRARGMPTGRDAVDRRLREARLFGDLPLALPGCCDLGSDHRIEIHTLRYSKCYALKQYLSV